MPFGSRRGQGTPDKLDSGTQKVRAQTGPDDNIFLEYAQTPGANYLVTGNLKHCPAIWAGTLIVTARQFLDVVV